MGQIASVYLVIFERELPLSRSVLAGEFRTITPLITASDFSAYGILLHRRGIELHNRPESAILHLII
ncbi:Uncharacterised protein [BD1-7 clade bacterium]|nr:Uncharacterised protein [BD1-7 clade bacterium]